MQDNLQVLWLAITVYTIVFVKVAINPAKYLNEVKREGSKNCSQIPLMPFLENPGAYSNWIVRLSVIPSRLH